MPPVSSLGIKLFQRFILVCLFPGVGIHGAESINKANALWHLEFKCCLKGRTPHPLPMEGSIVPTTWRPHGLLAGGHAETCPEDVKEGEKGPREQETLH